MQNGIGILLDGSNNSQITNCTIHGNTIGIKVVNSTGSEIELCEVSDNNIGILLDDNSTGSRIHSSYLYNNTNIGIEVHNSTCNQLYNLEIANGTTGILIEDSWRKDEKSSKPINTIQETKIYGCYYGIYIDNSCHIQIGTPFSPISALHNPNDRLSVFSCNLTSNNIGIYINNSSRINISLCKIEGADSGIYLSNSSDNNISFTGILNGSCGIRLEESSRNVIMESIFYNNAFYSVYIAESSSNNSIYHNNFMNLAFRQAYDAGTNNTWYNKGQVSMESSSPKAGNYWIDYQGEDADGDGIGDTPYHIPGPADSLDYYPVMDVYGWWR